MVGPDGELTVPSVDDHSQPHRGRTPVVGDGIQCGSNGATGEEHVVDEHHGLVRDVRHRLGALDDGCVRDLGQVVPVVGDVEASDGNLHPLMLADHRRQALRQRHASAVDAHHDEAIGSAVALDDLVRDADQRTPQVVGAHDLAPAHGDDDAIGLSGPMAWQHRFEARFMALLGGLAGPR